jgi:cell filamentation protein
MLLVHAELCRRAGFSVDWTATRKNDYLAALTEEIRSPGKGILDRYLKQFIGQAQEPETWLSVVASLPGLDGGRVEDHVQGDFSDPAVAEKYRQFEMQRGYAIKDHDR